MIEWKLPYSLTLHNYKFSLNILQLKKVKKEK